MTKDTFTFETSLTRKVGEDAWFVGVAYLHEPALSTDKEVCCQVLNVTVGTVYFCTKLLKVCCLLRLPYNMEGLECAEYMELCRAVQEQGQAREMDIFTYKDDAMEEAEKRKLAVLAEANETTD